MACRAETVLIVRIRRAKVNTLGYFMMISMEAR